MVLDLFFALLESACQELDVLLCSIIEYFYELCRILRSPWGESKQRVKILSNTQPENV